MNEATDILQRVTRRHLLGQTGLGFGAVAIAGLLRTSGLCADPTRVTFPLPHFAPRAKRVIYLGQYGGPSQLETFDYKPRLQELHGTELPASVRMGQRVTTTSAAQSSMPVVAPKYTFSQCGKSGQWVCDLLPFHQKIVDKLCVIRSIHTEAINHDPAITYLQTGSQIPGRPSFGSWLSYGLGSANEDLPAFIVLVANTEIFQPLSPRVWASGFLPSEHQGVKFRSSGDPVLYLSNPPGVKDADHRQMLEGLRKLNELQLGTTGDPEIAARIAQYEMAYRMQTSVPELMDMSDEPDHICDLYGPDSRKPGTYASHCLLARRLAERDVRFIQIYQRGWDHHTDLPSKFPRLCKHVDQPSAALILDLEQRGLLDDTLVIWAGEFGRGVYCEGKLTDQVYGRDHHGRCFSVWMAGGGVRPGLVYGTTDDFSYNIVEKPVHIHDLNATVLHCLGIDHERLTFKYQGRDFRLTDAHGRVVRDILS